MNRRQALTAGGAAAILAACAHVDLVSFDRGEFAITFTKLMTIGQAFVSQSIKAHTKNGVMDAKGIELDKFMGQLIEVQKRVEDAIISAPSNANAANAAGLKDVVDILMKVAPLILPLIAGAA